MTYLTLNDFDHFRNDKRIQFKTEKPDGKTEVITISYIFADNELWKIPNSLETRGIVFDKITGKCLARPFEKFFNLNENQFTQYFNLKNSYSKFDIFEKRDGSLVFPVRINQNLYFKTKKTFESDVAKQVNQFIDDKIETMCHIFIDSGFTPIFEWTSQDSKIVIDYGNDPQLTLLSARNIETGEYLDYDFMKEIASQYGIEVISRYGCVSNLDSLIEKCKTEKGKEGYVIHCNQLKIKLKTEWYYQNHRISTDLRFRDIAEMVIDEKFDDCLYQINNLGYDVEKALAVERMVIDDLKKIRETVENIVGSLENRDPAHVAKFYKNDQHFPLIMRMIRGQDVEYAKFWKRNFLKTYSLGSVYNQNF